MLTFKLDTVAALNELLPGREEVYELIHDGWQAGLISAVEATMIIDTFEVEVDWTPADLLRCYRDQN